MTIGLSLHIGLNRIDPSHYRDGHGNPWDGKLNACENDAKDMQALAASQGYKTAILLTENATANTVIEEITKASHHLKSGDIFFLTYSGHGGQVPDCTGEEEDNLDETWCCYDRQIIDDELYALWSKFRPGVRIFMLSDSCHSGSVARDILDQQDAADLGAPRALPLDVQMETYRSNQPFYDGLEAAHPQGDLVEIGASVILISGCADNQTSRDGWKNGKFTGTLLQVWDNGRFKGNTMRFYKCISALMPREQSPNYFKVGTPNPRFEHQHPFTV